VGPEVVGRTPASRSSSASRHGPAWRRTRHVVLVMLAILVVVTVFMPVVRFLGFDSEGAAYASYRSGYAYGAAAKQNRHVSVNCWREAKRRTWQADGAASERFSWAAMTVSQECRWTDSTTSAE